MLELFNHLLFCPTEVGMLLVQNTILGTRDTKMITKMALPSRETRM